MDHGLSLSFTLLPAWDMTPAGTVPGMPPRDPRLCPALERALPADDVPGTSRIPERPELYSVLFGDGEWHPVHVRSWSRDRHGRTVIGVEWHIGGETWGESYQFSAEKVREV